MTRAQVRGDNDETWRVMGERGAGKAEVSEMTFKMLINISKNMKIPSYVVLKICGSQAPLTKCSYAQP